MGSRYIFFVVVIQDHIMAGKKKTHIKNTKQQLPPNTQGADEADNLNRQESVGLKSLALEEHLRETDPVMS